MNELAETWGRVLEQVSGGNQMIASAITLWALGVGTYIMRNVPGRVWVLLKRQLSTSMTMNNGGWWQEGSFNAFMCWVQPRVKEGLSRTLSVVADYSARGLGLGLGYGIHVFVYERRVFWIVKRRLESGGSERQKDEVSIHTFGRSHKPFMDLLEQFRPKPGEDRIPVYHMNDDGNWQPYCHPMRRRLDSVAASEELKASLVEKIKHLQENKDWYYSRGLPHKLTFLMYGTPGGGKTSLIKALAGELGMKICIVNISQVTDKTLARALATTPPNSAVLIEDCDSSPAMCGQSASAPETEEKEKPPVVVQSLTRTGILNALDGVVPLDDCVVFLTTNHPEKIDPAVHRGGRVDYPIEIKEVAPGDVRRHAERLYPDYDFSSVEFLSTKGCLLHEALLKGRDNADEFVAFLVQSGRAQIHKESAAA